MNHQVERDTCRYPRRERTYTFDIDVNQASHVSPKLNDGRVEALDVAHHQDAARVLSRGDQLLTFLDRLRDRLLDQDIKAGFQQRLRQLGMGRGRNADDSRVRLIAQPFK